MPRYKVNNTLPIINGYIQDPLRPLINKNKLKYPTNPTNEIKIERGRFPGKYAEFTMVDIDFSVEEISIANDTYRAYHKNFARIGPNLVIAFGDTGSVAGSRTGYILDIKNNKIIRTFTHPTANISLTGQAWSLVNDQLIVLGSRIGGVYQNMVSIYDINSDLWTVHTGTIPVSDFGYAYPRIYNNKLWLFGYADNTASDVYTILCFDPKANKWENKGSIPIASSVFSMINQARNSYLPLNSSYFYLDVSSNQDVFEYNYDTGVRTTLPSFPGTVAARYVISIGRGRFFVMGGTTGIDYADHYIIDLYNGGTWTTCAIAPIASFADINFVYGHKVFEIGVRNFGSQYLACQVYDINSDSWTRIDDVPLGIPVGDSPFVNQWVYAVIGNKLYIFDPSSRSAGMVWYRTATTLILDLDTHEWSSSASLGFDVEHFNGTPVNEYGLSEKYGLVAFPEFDNKIILSGRNLDSTLMVPTILEWSDHHVTDYQTLIHNSM